MRYEKPEVQEIGAAGEEIKVVETGNPMDFEPSTGKWGFVDPSVAD